MLGACVHMALDTDAEDCCIISRMHHRVAPSPLVWLSQSRIAHLPAWRFDNQNVVNYLLLRQIDVSLAYSYVSAVWGFYQMQHKRKLLQYTYFFDVLIVI